MGHNDQQPAPDGIQRVDGSGSTPVIGGNDHDVEIHDVKSVNSWRELLREIGVIVIGVLIALAAEQTVQWFHWQETVRTAHEALKGELTDAYQTAAERIIETPCLSAQLDILKARVLASGSALTPAPVLQTVAGPATYRHPSRIWDDTIWQSTLSEQVSSHFTGKERQQFAVTYSFLADLRSFNNEEDGAAGQLMTLGEPLALDPSLRGHFVELIEAERQRVFRMNLIAGQAMDSARSIMPELSKTLRDRVWLQDLTKPDTTLSYCRAHQLPLAAMPDA